MIFEMVFMMSYKKMSIICETSKKFLVENYQFCWNQTGWHVVEEIVSHCEMEIMVHSAWFFYSPASTSAENIRPLRKINLLHGKIKANIFDLASWNQNIFLNVLKVSNGL